MKPLPLFILAALSPFLFLRQLSADSSSPARPLRMALMAMTDSRVPVKYLKRQPELFKNAFKGETRLSFISPPLVEEADRIIFERILKDEAAAALEHYYHFRFEEAAALLAGREDLEALKIKALVAHSQADEKKARDSFIRLLLADPRFEPSAKDFPPQMIVLFQKVKEEMSAGARPSHSILKIGKYAFPSDALLEGWESRFRKLADTLDWDGILIHHLEPIGWNYKLTVSFFPGSALPGARPYSKSAELVDLKKFEEASKVLVKTMFSVDASRFLN